MPFSRQFVRIAAACAALLLLLVVLVWMSSRTNRVGPEAYKYVTALHSICHQEDPARLNAFVDQVTDAHKSGQVSAREFDLLESIIQRAQAGRWNAARILSRDLLENQVKKGTDLVIPFDK